MAPRGVRDSSFDADVEVHGLVVSGALQSHLDMVGLQKHSPFRAFAHREAERSFTGRTTVQQPRRHVLTGFTAK
jgi:hypothetical protein